MKLIYTYLLICITIGLWCGEARTGCCGEEDDGIQWRRSPGTTDPISIVEIRLPWQDQQPPKSGGSSERIAKRNPHIGTYRGSVLRTISGATVAIGTGVSGSWMSGTFARYPSIFRQDMYLLVAIAPSISDGTPIPAFQVGGQELGFLGWRLSSTASAIPALAPAPDVITAQYAEEMVRRDIIVMTILGGVPVVPRDIGGDRLRELIRERIILATKTIDDKSMWYDSAVDDLMHFGSPTWIPETTVGNLLQRASFTPTQGK